MVVKKVIRDSFEFVKNTGKQAGKIVPDVLGGMLEQAVKGGSQSAAQKQQAAQQMQQQTTSYKQKDEEELKKTRDALAALQRMQRTFSPKQKPAPRPYEATISEEEQRKAAATEAQKKQPLAVPVSKQTRGMLFGKRKIKGSEGMVKDTRVG